MGTDRRERLTERRREKTLVTPEAGSRWNLAYKLNLMGLTPERFAQMLETQGYACVMCRTPFKKTSASASTTCRATPTSPAGSRETNRHSACLRSGQVPGQHAIGPG